MKKEFLELVDKHFLPGHVLREVMNRTAIRVSYRAMPNIGAKIASHNAKLLREDELVVKRGKKERRRKENAIVTSVEKLIVQSRGNVTQTGLSTKLWSQQMMGRRSRMWAWLNISKRDSMDIKEP